MNRIESAIWAVDMDRTLLDTNKTFDVFATTCQSEDIVPVETIFNVKRETEASGGSFDVMTYLRTIGVDESGMSELYTSFVAKAQGESLLYDDAKPFMNSVARNAIIVTYGGQDWQQAKIEATGLSDYPHLITPFKHKGDLIKSWQQANGYVATASNETELVGKTVNLVDDKAISFTGLPDDCGGYLLNRGGTSLKSQAGCVPNQVITITSLAEITASPELTTVR